MTALEIVAWNAFPYRTYSINYGNFRARESAMQLISFNPK